MDVFMAGSVFVDTVWAFFSCCGHKLKRCWFNGPDIHPSKKFNLSVIVQVFTVVSSSLLLLNGFTS